MTYIWWWFLFLLFSMEKKNGNLTWIETLHNLLHSSSSSSSSLWIRSRCVCVCVWWYFMYANHELWFPWEEMKWSENRVLLSVDFHEKKWNQVKTEYLLNFKFEWFHASYEEFIHSSELQLTLFSLLGSHKPSSTYFFFADNWFLFLIKNFKF